MKLEKLKGLLVEHKKTYADFCEHCGEKLKAICDCWVLKKKYNCGFDKCKGYNLHIELFNRKGT